MIHGGNVWEGDPKSWLDFSANLRPEGPPEWVRDVLVRSLDHVRYYPDRSMRSARAGLARYLELPEEQVLPTAGGAAAIDLILSAGKGRVFIPQPTFGEYAARAAVHGREVVPLGSAPHSGSLSCVSTEKAAVPKDQATPRKGDTLVLCNPNNPDGRLLSAGQIMTEYDKVHAVSADLLVDEAFIG
ncbi:MAG: aminotransferase class I/II-fold pyridoxal phosphate-dependent enzyme, partial [Clostridia bacterium]|nr:aminotransferase class I/II-fold pyridoxal phosphate-dependent enzyme [Clostridia bacterium]